MQNPVAPSSILWEHLNRAHASRVSYGANVGAKDNQGVTPLHVAADGCQWEVEVMRVLLGHGANVSSEDNQGRTAVRECVDEGR